MLDLRQSQTPNGHTSSSRSYQNELRAIGRYADDSQMRHIGLYEVESGYILRGFEAGNVANLQALEIPEGDLDSLVLRNFTSQSKEGQGSHSALCPTGYEDYLRALGWEFDQNGAAKVGITEMEEGFLVTYLGLPATSQGFVWAYRSFIDSPADVQNRLDEAFGRRQGRR